MEKTESTIFRVNYLNIMAFNGMPIRAFKFYKDGEVVASVRWFGFTSNNDYERIDFTFDIKRRKKVDFSKGEAFIVITDETGMAGREYDLYIPSSFVGLELLEKDRLSTFDKQYDRYEDVFTANIHGLKRCWSKEKDERGRVITTLNEGDYIERFSCNFRAEKTPFHKKCVKLSSDIKQLCSVDLSYYEIERILEHYKIVKNQQK